MATNNGHWVVHTTRPAKICLAATLFAVLYLPFAAKPVHIDDANFLMLAEGAARDLWRPHSILINWGGEETEPAFGILANPPGIAWYLMPVRKAPEWVLHLWMLPWLLLAAWGCVRLSREYTHGNEWSAAIFLLTCPVVVVAAHALTPDLPLFACVVAGVGGFVTSKRMQWRFALLAGCAALFRYSGGAVIPLLVLIGWRRGRWRGAAAAMISAFPLAGIALHDVHAYGQVHILAMLSSQNDLNRKSLAVEFGNVVAGVAMLGGAGVLPILVWRKEAIAGAMLGAGIGLNAAFLSGQSASGTLPTVLCTAAGGAALSLAWASRVRHLELSVWAIGGALFFFVVRFAAARYWAAFVPAVGLLAIRNAEQNRRWIALGIGANVVLAFLIAVDDQNHARALRRAAQTVEQIGVGNFSGHWGWQHYLEAAGWTPLERGGEPASLHARSTAATQQPPDEAVCLELIDRFVAADHWWGPRVHAPFGEASYHAGGNGRYAPWTFSNEPYDVTSIYRRCDVAGEDASRP